jgi:hypothetical protein
MRVMTLKESFGTAIDECNSGCGVGGIHDGSSWFLRQATPLIAVQK